jgi:hypothetical protein
MSFDGKAFGAEIVSAVKDYIRRRVEPLEERIAALESHGIKYAGAYQRAVSYRRGTVVTSDGAMWVALRDTTEGERPGKVHDAWQLSAKAAATGMPQ